MSQSAENDAPLVGCVCDVIADVAGARLSDRTIMELCASLRPHILPPGGGEQA